MKPIDTTKPTEPAKTTAVDDARERVAMKDDLGYPLAGAAELEGRIEELQDQLRQEREAKTEWAGIAGTHAGSIELLQAKVAQLNEKLGDQGTAIHAYVLELSKAEAQVAQLQATVGQPPL